MREKFASIVMALLVFASSAVWSQERRNQPVCWPLHFGGITLGVNQDSHVRRLLGEGVFRRELGDTGGRLFIDSKRAATLRTVSYTDGIVGQLTLSTGIDQSLSSRQRRQATSRFFDPGEGFGNFHALRLGSTRAEVLENLGPPEGGTESAQWSYSTACTCELPKGFTITFEKERVVKVVFSAPSG
jgi:hypothetical protein